MVAPTPYYHVRQPIRRPARTATWMVVGLTALWSCGEDKTGPPPTPTGVQASAGDAQTTAAGTSVTTAPAVLVTGDNGPISGVAVAFAVASGGGSVTTASATSNSNGIASAGSWVLGTSVGPNTLTATVTGLPQVTFTAQAIAGAPAGMVLSSGNGQIATVGMPVAVNPAVRVEDQFGNPVGNVSVAFAVTSGGGSIAGGTATTNAGGVATAGQWTLGTAAGGNTLAATAQGTGISGNPVVFSATGAASLFDIVVRFDPAGLPTASQQALFTAAAARWQQLIVGDIPDDSLNISAGSCAGAAFPALNEALDDVVIYAAAVPIDGAGGILGQAGPCLVRSGSLLPGLGGMQFDTADLTNLEAQGRLLDVILHEMGHVLGLGTIWNDLGLLQNPSCGGSGPTCNPDSSGADTHFPGAAAVASFNAAGGTAWMLGTPVPVENTLGGRGTRDGHWRESTFGNELMTGFINAGTNPLSEVTTASMQDIGYVINLAGSDGYTLANPNALRATLAAGTIELKNDMWLEPVLIDTQGRVVRDLRPR